MRWSWIAALLGACSSDGRFEIPGLLEPPCELESSYFMVDSIEFPQTAQSDELGLDLDLDGRADNGLGVARRDLAADIADSPVDLDAALAAALENRNLIWVIELQLCIDRDDGHLRLRSRPGLEYVDDFEGGAMVVLVPMIEPTSDPPAVGLCEATRCRAEFGFGLVPLTAFADSRADESPSIWLDSLGLAADFELSNEALQGRLGMGFNPLAAFDLLVEPVTRTVDDVVQSDPGCPDACETDAGQTMTESFDANRDHRITVDEFLENRILLELAVSPQADLLAEHDGERIYWPGHDGGIDSSSLGIGFTAQRVTVLDSP